MIIIGVAVLVGVIYGLAVTHLDPPGLRAFISFTGGVIGALVGVMLAFVVGFVVYDSGEYSYQFPIVDAADGSRVEGQFSIFGGYIEEEPYYFFYRKNADGGIYQGKIRANNTLIYEDQETRNFIKVTKCDTELKLWGITQGCEKSYEIHVPAGSVDRKVEFDLE